MTPPAAAVAETLPRPRPATRRTPVRHPRRTSGPARPARPLTAPGRPAQRTSARPRSAQADGRGLALRAIAAYERVCDSALLDRLVRGRLWIGLIAFSLIGIVAMQLMVLKLNSGIGASLTRAAELQRANAQLGIEAATGSGEGRIEPLAAATGMTFAAPGSVHFVASSPASDVAHAAAVLAAPIQPHEYVASSSEAAVASGAAGEASVASGESASGPSGPGELSSGSSESSAPSEASSRSSAGESGTAGSGEAQAAEASAATATATETEASAGAAGGVAAGH